MTEFEKELLHVLVKIQTNLAHIEDTLKGILFELERRDTL